MDVGGVARCRARGAIQPEEEFGYRLAADIVASDHGLNYKLCTPAATGRNVGCGVTRADRSVFWPGVPMALAAAVLFGAAAPFAKLLLGTVEPQLLAGL